MSLVDEFIATEHTIIPPSTCDERQSYRCDLPSGHTGQHKSSQFVEMRDRLARIRNAHTLAERALESCADDAAFYKAKTATKAAEVRTLKRILESRDRRIAQLEETLEFSDPQLNFNVLREFTEKAVFTSAEIVVTKQDDGEPIAFEIMSMEFKQRLVEFLRAKAEQ